MLALDARGQVRVYTRLLKKFSHLDENDLREFQQRVDQRFAHIHALTRLNSKERKSAIPRRCLTGWRT